MVVGSDGRLRVWHAESGRVVELMTESARAESAPQSDDPIIITDTNPDPGGWRNHVAWEPDGAHVLTFKDQVQVWSADNGEKLLDLTDKPSEAPRFSSLDARWSPDGEGVLVDDQGQVHIIEINRGSNSALGVGDTTPIRKGSIGRIKQPWNPDGTRVLTREENANAMHVWDAATGDEVALLTGDADFVINEAEWSPTGEYVIGVNSANHVRIWSLKPAMSSSNADGFFESWSPNGKYLITTTGGGREDRRARVWDAATGTEVEALEATGHSKLIPPGLSFFTFKVDEWSPDGQSLIVYRHSNLPSIQSAVDWRKSVDLVGHAGQITGAAWAPGGDRVATSSEDGTVRVWDARSGEIIRKLEGHSGPVNDVAWSPDGEFIASAGDDAKVRVWRAADGFPVMALEGHNGPVRGVAWSPQRSSPLLLSYRDRQNEEDASRIWNVETRQQVMALTGNDGSNVHEAYWNATGDYIAAITDRYEVYLWRQGAWEPVVGMDGDATAWSPDGKYLAGDKKDWSGTVMVWDVAKRAMLSEFAGHKGDVNALRWSPNGQQLVTASADGKVRTWNLRDLAVSAVLSSGEIGSWSGVEWSPDGRFIAFGTQFEDVVISPAQLEELVAHACARAVRNLGEADWKEFIAQQEPQAICEGKLTPGKDYPNPQNDTAKG
jgi:WD40 repeat protein